MVSSALEVVIVPPSTGSVLVACWAVDCANGAVAVLGVVLDEGTSAASLISPFEQPTPSKATVAKRKSVEEVREKEIICLYDGASLIIEQYDDALPGRHECVRRPHWSAVGEVFFGQCNEL